MHAKEKSAKLKQGPNFIVAIPEAASRDEKLKFMCRAVLKVSERLNNSQINKDECPSLGKLLCESLSSSFQSASPLPLPLPLPHSFPVTLSVFLTYDSPRLQIESLVFYFFLVARLLLHFLLVLDKPYLPLCQYVWCGCIFCLFSVCPSLYVQQ